MNICVSMALAKAMGYELMACQTISATNEIFVRFRRGMNEQRIVGVKVIENC